MLLARDSVAISEEKPSTKYTHIPHKMKHRSTVLHDPAIPLLGIHPEELKAGSQRDIYTLAFIAALCTIGNR